MTTLQLALFSALKKNEAIVKYSVLNDGEQIFASKYRLTLPTAEELQREIEEERRLIEDRQQTISNGEL